MTEVWWLEGPGSSLGHASGSLSTDPGGSSGKPRDLLCVYTSSCSCLFPGRQQQLEAERLNEYVNADHDLYYNNRRTIEPPTERPDERRQAEMKRLYGNSAAKILAMETAVQLSFDKHCDRKHPKYWPVIPLKF